MADFCFSQVMLGVLFLFFSFQMYFDSVVKLEYFLFEDERFWQMFFFWFKDPNVATM